MFKTTDFDSFVSLLLRCSYTFLFVVLHSPRGPCTPVFQSAFPLLGGVPTTIPLTLLLRLMVVREMNHEILWIAVCGRLVI